VRTFLGKSGNHPILSLSLCFSVGGPKGYKWARSSAPWTSDMTLPAVLTIGGSYPSGGAGIQVSTAFAECFRGVWRSLPLLQADLKTFAVLNCYGTSVITTLAAQNTTGTRGIHPCPPEFVKDQVSSRFYTTHLVTIDGGFR